MIAEQAAAKVKQDLAKNDGFVEVGRGGKVKSNPSAAAAPHPFLAILNVS